MLFYLIKVVSVVLSCYFHPFVWKVVCIIFLKKCDTINLLRFLYRNESESLGGPNDLPWMISESNSSEKPPVFLLSWKSKKSFQSWNDNDISFRTLLLTNVLRSNIINFNCRCKTKLLFNFPTPIILNFFIPA